MINDNCCQTECNTSECGWDGLDCGCAPRCNTIMYGLCKEPCLVLSCNYDAMPGFPACSVEATRLASRTMQGFLKNAVVYSHNFYCGLNAPLCTAALWEQSISTCVPQCESSAPCLNSFGNCGQDCALFPGCERCSDLMCLSCKPGKVSFYLECRDSCPPTFQVSPVDGSTCDPLPSTSTSTHPDTYYVSAQESGLNQGTYEHPFCNLHHALTAAHGDYVRIYLLRGVHQLSYVYSNAYIRQISHTSLFESQAYTPLNLDIRPLYCSEDSHSQCVSAPYITLQLSNLRPSTLYLRGTTVLQGILFDGYVSLVPGCLSDFCTYCPAITRNKAGNYMDDRENEVTVGTFAPQQICDAFHKYSFIAIENGGNVTLQNMAFEGFRQQFASIISFTEAQLTLSNVTFKTLIPTKQLSCRVKVAAFPTFTCRASQWSC